MTRVGEGREKSERSHKLPVRVQNYAAALENCLQFLKRLNKE